ncbi:MAG: hypothetical protein OXB87_01445 [Hyphomicrobiales bacterium]|nr:hypothetical protein [Hyphomicrobiales bacterium]
MPPSARQAAAPRREARGSNVIPFGSWRRGTVVGALDIGHSKICCLIAELPRRAGQLPHLLGFGEVATRHDSFLYPDYFKRALAMARADAEKMAGRSPARFVVSSSFLSPSAVRRAGHVRLRGAVDDAAYAEVLRASFRRLEDETRALLHAVVLSCTVDNEASLRDPRGLRGEQLGMAMLGVSVPQFHLQRLDALLAQAHVRVAKYVAPAYASVLAARTQEEEDGYLCLDLGARRTGFALFSRGAMVHLDELPVGGWHISNDIALGCELPFAVAERAKWLFGHALGEPPGESMRYEHLLPGESDAAATKPYMIDCARLGAVIRPRVEEMLEMLKTRLADAGLGTARWKRVLLCGGGASLRGLPELTRLVLRKKTRVLNAPLVAGRYALAPRHSAVWGLLHYVQEGEAAQLTPRTMHAAGWMDFLNAAKWKNAFHTIGESINP